jgi:hypothetical protein
MEPMNSEDIAEIEAALADQERELLNLKGKHIKSVLSRLERIGALNKDVRKIILDEFNDLTRDNLRYLGFEVAD